MPACDQRACEQLRTRAKKLGATEFGRSRVKNKKYYVVYTGKRINFGARGYDDYTTHRDPKRRKSYRSRHSGILDGSGKPAYLTKTNAAYWAWNLLW